MGKNYFRLSAKLQTKHKMQAANMRALVFFVAVFFITGLPFSVFAQTPSISYSNNHTYNTGTPITPLAPTITGMRVGSHNVATVSLDNGFHNPLGVAADAASNVYVADNENHQVKKIPSGENNPQIKGSGFRFPTDFAVDAAGNVYVVDYGKAAIKKIPVDGGEPVSIGSGFKSPTGVAIDTRENVYVTDRSNHAVKKIPFGRGAPVTIGSGFKYPAGVAVDPSGNVYVADYGNNAVKEILVNGERTITLGSGFVHPNSVALDASGNVYVTDEANNPVKMIPVGGGTPVPVGFNAPFGITADATGNNADKNIKSVDSYSISPALPTGLNFDTTTGIISGTPAAVSPATTYTITANAGTANNSAQVNISVVSFLLPPNISYNDACNYTIGVRIAALAPTGNTAETHGYIIIPALPPGLSFDNVTGIISGTPTEATPQTTYYITAYNTTGRNTAKVDITITDPSQHPSPVTDPRGSNTIKGLGLLVNGLSPGQDISEPVVRQAVSPNGDGINDILTIDNIQSYPDNKLTLINRNGSEIFQTTCYDNVNKVFDGHSNIKHTLQQPGTYFYLLEYKVNGEVKRKTGFFILRY